MADYVDIANDLAQLERDYQINKLLREKKQKPVGLCYYCKERTNLIFCDKDCESDYLLEQKIKKQNGRG